LDLFTGAQISGSIPYTNYSYSIHHEFLWSGLTHLAVLYSYRLHRELRNVKHALLVYTKLGWCFGEIVQTEGPQGIDHHVSMFSALVLHFRFDDICEKITGVGSAAERLNSIATGAA